MKKAYNEIIARMVRAIESGNVPTWEKPWIDAGGVYPDAIHSSPRIDAVIDRYYQREKIGRHDCEQDGSYYAPDADAVTLPLPKQFVSIDAYNAVRAHETIHSTGDYTRCNRETFNEYKSFRFGDVRYTREELVAELGACFLLCALGLDTSFAERNATAYIATWLTQLNNNTYWIHKASALAEEAVEYILEIAGEDIE